MKTLLLLVPLLSFIACGNPTQESKTENTEVPIEAAEISNTEAGNTSENIQKNDKNSEKQETLKFGNFDFVGKFTYTEKIGNNAGGTTISYIHMIDIEKENEGYKATYSVNGYQTSIELLCSVVEVKINAAAPASSLMLVFEKYGENQIFKNPDAYKAQEALIDIGPKGGIMADANEKDAEVIFMRDMTTEGQKGKTVVFERL